jgi:heptosyltransferase I
MLQTQISSSPLPVPAGRLMILNVGRIGDTILRNSILAPALRTFAKVDYLCGPDNAEMLRHDSRLNRITVFQNTPGGFASLLWAALRQRYDALIDLKHHDSSTSLILARFFRSRVKFGANRDRFQSFDRDTRTVIAPSLHLTEIMRRIGQQAGLPAGDYKPLIVLSPESKQWFRKNHVIHDRPFIFLNISASNPDRLWPVENWAQYVRGCGLAGQPILVNGMPKDRELVHRLCRELPNTTAFQPRGFMDVASAIEAAQLVLTMDTGVVHVCSALDKPVVALYSEEFAFKAFGPLSTWRLVILANDGSSVSNIGAAQAIAQTRSRGLPAPFGCAVQNG